MSIYNGYINYGDTNMNYSTACELLGFTTPKTLAENAALAKSRLNNIPNNAPLRIKVACKVLINASL